MSPPFSANIIEIPNEFDILLGRRRVAVHHAGNLQLRHLVDERIQEYMASSRSAKTQMIIDVVQGIHQSGGIFLKYNAEGNWEKIDMQAAREKVGHQFRDAANHQKKKQQEQHSSKSTTSKRPLKESPPKDTPKVVTPTLSSYTPPVFPRPFDGCDPSSHERIRAVSLESTQQEYVLHEQQVSGNVNNHGSEDDILGRLLETTEPTASALLLNEPSLPLPKLEMGHSSLLLFDDDDDLLDEPQPSLWARVSTAQLKRRSLTLAELLPTTNIIEWEEDLPAQHQMPEQQRTSSLSSTVLDCLQWNDVECTMSSSMDSVGVLESLVASL